MFFEFLNFIIGKVLFFCGSIVGDCFPKPLSPEKERECLEKFRKTGDKEAKDTLIKHNLRLVAHVVKKYQGADDNDDLISTGTIGLIKAINSYDPSKGLGMIAAALVTGISGIGGGIAVAAGAPAAIGATSEDPKVFGKALIFVALGESIALYGLVISIMILGKY